MQKQFMIIVVLLLVLASAAALLFNHQQKQQNNEQFETTALIEKVLNTPTAQANSEQSMLIERVEIERAGEMLLIAEQNEDEWLAVHLSNHRPFKMQHAELLSLVRTLSDAKVIEYKSNKAQHHAKLGLADPSPENNDTGLVRIVPVNGKTIEILIGGQSSLQNGQYVRMKGNNQMMLIDKLIELPDNSVDWLQSDLFNFNSMDVQSIVRYETSDKTTSTTQDDEHSGTVMWRMEQVTPAIDEAGNTNNSQQLALADMQSNEELVYEEALNNYLSAINDLRFDDISELNEMQWSTLTPALTLHINTKQGSTHVLTIVQSDEQYLASVIGEQNLAHLNAWQFKLPNYQAEALLKVREDFVKVREQEVPAE